MIRDRLTHLCFIGEGDEDPTGLMESAFIAVHEAQPVMKKIYAAQKQGTVPRKIPMEQLIAKALELNVINADEAKQLTRMNELRFSSISVDSFKPGVLSEHSI